MNIDFISDTEYLVSGVTLKDIQNQRYCVFDFEATGIDHESEYITQIGAVLIEGNKILEEKTFNTYIKSPKKIPEAVERFTGVYNKYLENAPTLTQTYKEFQRFTKDTILVTHAGYEFDLPLLNRECQRNNLDMLTNTCLDTKALFSYLYPEIKDIIWTDFLVKYYGIKNDDLRRHDALDDSKLIARIFVTLLKEFEKRGKSDIDFIDPVRVKRFEVIPMT
ncbi:3'-5' exonuclease [Paenibacillus harenae]|uniref:3'-5' exonuclease n=1 Tax=Paenibacillus harenae TaxID=306543 RepID=UPI00048C8EC9|nr:3'-5' exonuclease [Paenibacillus harenae]